MKKLIFLLVALLAMNGAMAQWFPQNSGTTSNLNSVYFTDANTGYVVGKSGTILKTIDGGANWMPQISGTNQSLHSVFFADSETGYVVGNHGAILKTINAGTVWTAMTSGTIINLSAVQFPGVSIGYAVGDNGTILKTTDAGITWNSLSSGMTDRLESVCFTDTNTGYTVGYIGRIRKTIDGGTTWEGQSLGYQSLLTSVCFPEPDTGYITGWDYSGERSWYSAIYKTTNGGANWDLKLAEWSDTIGPLNSIYFTDANSGFAVGGNIILKTIDGGNTWIHQSFNGNYFTSVYFTDANTGYAVGNGGTILKTTNGGGSPGCLPEGITFSTQEQIDNFQTNYPGCTEIEGDVYIWGDVFNLDGLSVLTSIVGDFSILTSHLTNMAGMENLTSIGGGLLIGNWSQYGPYNDSLTSFSGLDNLVSIGGDLIIVNNYLLSDLSALANLTSIGGALKIYNSGITSLNGLENINTGSITDLNISENNQLSNCEAQNICNYLSSPNGVVNITHNADGCNSPTEIANACGITMPCLPYGNYYFFSQADVDNFQADYSGCYDLQGNVSIHGDDIVNLSGFSGVSSISGDLKIGRYYNDTPYGNPVLTSLTGFENLTRIDGTLLIINNDTLTSLSGLDNLSSIGNDLLIGVESGYITGMEALTNINALGSLISIGGEMFITSTSLSSLTGLDNVSTVGGNITIYYNDYLTDISSLNKLTSIAGGLTIGCTALSSLEGLNNVTTIDRSLRINKNHSLKNFEGLNNLSYIGTGAWISYNDSLTSFEGLNNLEYIDGYLTISDNPALSGLSGLENLDSIGSILHISRNGLTSLSALSGLQSIKESLVIRNNDQLTSLSGLDHVFADSITELKIFNNALLQTCDVQSICDYLAAPNGTVDIHDNAPGCNSPEEVEAACEQHCLPEGITFTTQEQIDNFQTNYPGCTEIEGDVIISGSNITNLNGLNVLTSIQGKLALEGNSILVNLIGLDNLSAVGGSLSIYNNPLLSDISSLGSLTSIGDGLILGIQTWLSHYWGNPLLINLNGLEGITSLTNLSIIGNHSLTDLTGLNNVLTISDQLLIAGNDSLSSLNGIEELSYIGGNLQFGSGSHSGWLGNPALINLTGLEGLTKIGGDLKFAGSSLMDLEGLNNLAIIGNDLILYDNDLITFTGLDNLDSIHGNFRIGPFPPMGGGEWSPSGNSIPDFTGIENLTSIGGDLVISWNDSLSSLAGLENLTSIGGDLIFYVNGKLTSLVGLDNLTSIEGGLNLYSNPALTSLSGLENLSFLGGDLSIGGYYGGNASLTNVAALNNINEGSISNLKIARNQSLFSCDAQSICTYLASPNGTVDIYDNAPGCNSPDEVNATCTFSVEPIGLDDEINVYPNPAGKTLAISGHNDASIQEIFIYNQTGQKVLQGKPVNNTLNISKLQPGMYIVELVTNQGNVKKKLMVE